MSPRCYRDVAGLLPACCQVVAGLSSSCRRVIVELLSSSSETARKRRTVSAALGFLSSPNICSEPDPDLSKEKSQEDALTPCARHGARLRRNCFCIHYVCSSSSAPIQLPVTIHFLPLPLPVRPSVCTCMQPNTPEQKKQCHTRSSRPRPQMTTDT